MGQEDLATDPTHTEQLRLLCEWVQPILTLMLLYTTLAVDSLHHLLGVSACGPLL